jgi:hypothetical protein
MRSTARKLQNLPLHFCLLQVAVCGAVCAPIATAQSVIRVAPNGDDSADGSAAHPFKTLSRAERQVRELRAAGKPAWARIEIAPGEYVLEEPLTFAPNDSGESPEHPITYAATEKGGVRISGGTRITGFRQLGSHWVANVPKSLPPFRELWVNERRAVRARSPNDGFFRIAQAGPDNRTSFVVEPNDLLALAHPEAAEILFLHDWSTSRVRLSSIDAAARTYQLADPIGPGSPIFAISNFELHPRYFVENAPELLDTPGEWFLDAAKNELHYMPRDGEAIHTLEVIAPQLGQLLALRGEGDEFVENVRFEGLTFCHTRFDLPPHGYVESQANWHERRAETQDQTTVAMPAAVTLDRTRDCSFANCRFEHLAAAGLHVAHSQNTKIEHSTFGDLGGNGVMIGSPHGDDVPAAEDNLVENCLIERCGQTFFGAVGVWVGMSVETTVRNNEIRDLPYTGISVGWCWDDRPTICRGHNIRANNIHHVMQLLSDGGGIYTLGRQPGTVLAGNVIHDIPINAGRAESNGFFLDEGTTELLVEANTFYHIARSPIRFHKAGKNTLVANRLALRAGTPAFTYNVTNASDMTFMDNEEIAGGAWRPPADDARVKQAGPQPDK